MKRKKIAKHFTLLVVMSFLMWNCEKEVEFLEVTSINSKSEFTVSYLNRTVLKEENKTVWETISKFKDFGRPELKDADNQEYGFTINTNTSLEIKSSDFTSYTFEIHRDQQEDGFWENYVLTIYPDQSFIQYLVKYPILPEGGYDKENAEYTAILSDNLLSRGTSGTCVDLSTQFVDVECELIYCGTEGHEDGQMIGTPSCPATWDNPIDTTCTLTLLTNTNISCFGGGDTIGGEGGATSGGSTSATDPYGYYSPANIVIRTLGYDVSSSEAIWLYENSEGAILLRNFLGTLPSTSLKEKARILTNLYMISNEGESFDFDELLSSSGAPSFENVNEFEAYINSVDHLSVDEDTITDQTQSTVTREVKFDIDPVLNTKLVISVQQDTTNPEKISILNVHSYLQGITSFRDWTQLANHDIETRLHENKIIIKMKGLMKTGVVIKGYGIYVTQTYHLRIEFNLKTGVLVESAITLID